MPLQFTLRQSGTIPLEVEGITPASCRELSLHEIEHVSIQYGNRQLPLGEFFSVAGDPSSQTHVWSGELSSVHWLGAAMNCGALVIEGNVGRHLGSGMSGGRIEVAGDASDWLGAEMRGGLIHVRGSAGLGVGAAYRGSRTGMRGGTILVEQHVGHELGHTMRRGLIAVGGRCGDLAGYNMLAGSILVFGPSGARHGAGMRRGTLAFFSTHRTIPLPTFHYACTFRPLAMTLLLRQLRSLGFPVPESIGAPRYDLYHGDAITGGRGELLLVA